MSRSVNPRKFGRAASTSQPYMLHLKRGAMTADSGRNHVPTQAKTSPFIPSGEAANCLPASGAGAATHHGQLPCHSPYSRRGIRCRWIVTHILSGPGALFRAAGLSVRTAVLPDVGPIDCAIQLLALDLAIRQALNRWAVLRRNMSRVPPLLDDLVAAHTQSPRHCGESLEMLDGSLDPVHGAHLMLVFLVLLVSFVWPQFFLVDRIRA